ncbi:MAG: riboflavin synthase [Desulfobacteraceae bacterium]
MFTGLIEGVGRVLAVRRRAGDLVLVLEPCFPAQECREGESVCVDGACLTVTSIRDGALSMDVSAETVSRTTLGALGRGDEVNLERALKVGDRLGGHLVSGHVDAVGRIATTAPVKGSRLVGVEIPAAVSRYTIEKGSVAVDGISLTINSCRSGFFEVNIIPLTGRETTLLKKRPGDRVNIETDLIGKYVEKLLEAGARPGGGAGGGGIRVEDLQEHGFLD